MKKLLVVLSFASVFGSAVCMAGNTSSLPAGNSVNAEWMPLTHEQAYGMPTKDPNTSSEVTENFPLVINAQQDNNAQQEIDSEAGSGRNVDSEAGSAHVEKSRFRKLCCIAPPIVFGTTAAAMIVWHMVDNPSSYGLIQAPNVTDSNDANSTALAIYGDNSTLASNNSIGDFLLTTAPPVIGGILKKLANNIPQWTLSDSDFTNTTWNLEPESTTENVASSFVQHNDETSATHESTTPPTIEVLEKNPKLTYESALAFFANNPDIMKNMISKKQSDLPLILRAASPYCVVNNKGVVAIKAGLPGITGDVTTYENFALNEIFTQLKEAGWTLNTIDEQYLFKAWICDKNGVKKYFLDYIKATWLPKKYVDKVTQRVNQYLEKQPDILNMLVDRALLAKDPLKVTCDASLKETLVVLTLNENGQPIHAKDGNEVYYNKKPLQGISLGQITPFLFKQSELIGTLKKFSVSPTIENNRLYQFGLIQHTLAETVCKKILDAIQAKQQDANKISTEPAVEPVTTFVTQDVSTKAPQETTEFAVDNRTTTDNTASK